MELMEDVTANEKAALHAVDSEALLRRWEPLARRLAHRFEWAAEREDLEQVARLGLLQAARRFEPARGYEFSSFAVPTIVGELHRYVRDRALTIKIPRRWWDLRRRLKEASLEMEQELGRAATVPELAERLGVDEEDVAGALEVHEFCHLKSLDEPSEDCDREEIGARVGTIGSEDPRMEAVERRIALRQALAELPLRLRRIVVRRYFEGKSQLEIGRDLGLSQMQISRMERQALARLRQEFQGRAAVPPIPSRARRRTRLTLRGSGA